MAPSLGGRRRARSATVGTPEVGDGVQSGSRDLTSVGGHLRAGWQRPPRLVLRFAVYTAVGLAVAGGVIVLLVRSYATSQAENAIAYHARFVAEVALGSQLRPSDFERPVGAARRRTLDRLFRRQVLVDGVLRASLYAPDGKVTYSTDHQLIGRTTGESTATRSAAAGTLVRHVVRRLQHGPQRKVLAEFVPVRFGHSRPVGVFAFDQDYEPVARTAWSQFLPISLVLELLLVVLYVSLFPILRRVTRRLRGHVEELEYHALYDSLTALPNRALFQDRLQHAIATADRDRSRVAVMLLDLDRFKEVNDILGHQSGDELLRELALRLAGVLRATDTIARLGGDEFALVLPFEHDSDVADAAGRLRDTFEESLSLEGISVTVRPSIGVALYPEHGKDVETLVKHADIAMYAAKERHSPYEIYTASRDTKDASRLTLADELRSAISDGALELVYQPKAELDSGRIDSVEALVRWPHASRGLLLPSEFIPLAEQTGLIKPLTGVVLEQAVRQSALWSQAGLNVSVAVNLDTRNLLDLEFPDQVSDLLSRWNVRPQSLILEITEATMMADPARIAAVVATLSDMGVAFSIDDFGTGYTSFANLKNLPVSELKIDRSFVSRIADDHSDATIVRTIIDLGRNLSLRVVAEGVETPRTWQLLEALECDVAQGFFIAKPMRATDVPPLLDHRSHGAATVG